ncbi:MAG: phosphatidate cytidylyltransferase [Candidatus Sericytochromatia bacterium]|nr:phosphatidate cytidylyltransferase [Candidatus Sericytochromatia bacterium]
MRFHRIAIRGGKIMQPDADSVSQMHAHAPVGIRDRAKFRQRLVFGILAAALAVTFVILGGPWLLGLLLVLCFFACREYFELVEAKGYRPASRLATVSAMALMVLTDQTGTRFHGLFLTLSIILCFLALILRGAPWYPRVPRLDLPDAHEEEASMATIADVATTAMGILYCGWMPGFILLLRKFEPIGLDPADGLWLGGVSLAPTGYPAGLWVTLMFFAAVIGSDVGGFFFGKFFGRHPLIGPLSPRKTLEGAIGGVGTAVLGALAVAGLAHVVPSGSSLAGLDRWPLIAAFAALVALTAQVSDLSESLIKRDVGRRDAAELIPGHGGMLDRVDGYLLSASVAFWFVLHYWVLPAGGVA